MKIPNDSQGSLNVFATQERIKELPLFNIFISAPCQPGAEEDPGK